jgi:hypothetical protein
MRNIGLYEIHLHSLTLCRQSVVLAACLRSGAHGARSKTGRVCIEQTNINTWRKTATLDLYQPKFLGSPPIRREATRSLWGHFRASIDVVHIQSSCIHEPRATLPLLQLTQRLRRAKSQKQSPRCLSKTFRPLATSASMAHRRGKSAICPTSY